MKKIRVLFLLLVFALGICAVAGASDLDIADGADLLEESTQFPFFAETDENAVNVREETSAKSKKTGRLERGERLTVLAASVNDAGEMWYAVELSDGTKGYIRSDLLIKAEEMDVMRASHEVPAEKAQREYIGNKKSKKFHESSCRTLPKESNRVYFTSRDEALDKGYDPCGNCRP